MANRVGDLVVQDPRTEFISLATSCRRDKFDIWADVDALVADNPN